MAVAENKEDSSSNFHTRNYWRQWTARSQSTNCLSPSLCEFADGEEWLPITYRCESTVGWCIGRSVGNGHATALFLEQNLSDELENAANHHRYTSYWWSVTRVLFARCVPASSASTKTSAFCVVLKNVRNLAHMVVGGGFVSFPKGYLPQSQFDLQPLWAQQLLLCWVWNIEAALWVQHQRRRRKIRMMWKNAKIPFWRNFK